MSKILAIMDTSGSMSGGKITAVKRSLINLVDSMKKENPEGGFGLIIFGKSVIVYSKEGKACVNISSEDIKKLTDKKALEKIAKDVKKHVFAKISTDYSRIIDLISNLNTDGITPLGTALYLGYHIAEEGTRVVLLTDGEANAGLGNLNMSDARQFYEYLGELFSGKGVPVDLIGVAGGISLQLQTVGRVADYSGGDVYYITSEKIEEAFDMSRKKEVIAVKTNVRVAAPIDVTLYGGPKIAQKEVQMGAVDKRQKIYIELKAPKEKKLRMEKIPLQVQIRYYDPDGNEHLRVIEQKYDITTDENEFKQTIQQDVFSRGTTSMISQVAMEHGDENAMRIFSAVQSKIPLKNAAQIEKMLKEKNKDEKFTAQVVQKRGYI